MPILPKRSAVILPSDASQLAPAARRLVANGLEIDDDDDLEGYYIQQPAMGSNGVAVKGAAAFADGGLLPERDPRHSWWHDRVQRASAPRKAADTQQAGGGAAGGHKRQKTGHH